MRLGPCLALILNLQVLPKSAASGRFAVRGASQMTIDKSLKVKAGAISNRNVLTRAERIAKLKEAERWKEGESVLGLPKVRVLKLAMKKKKKAKAEEGAEGAAAPAAGGAAAAKPLPPSRPLARKPAAGAKPAARRSSRRAGRHSGCRCIRHADACSASRPPCASSSNTAAQGLDVELPDERIVRTLGVQGRAAAARSAGRAAGSARRSPIGTPPLAELARGRKDACIVICDITRPVPNEMILPPMLEMLEAAGIPREKITILVATGLHRPNEGDELVEMVGQQIVENYRIENHHGQELDEHTYLGDSPRGVPIWIDSRYVEGRSEDHHRPDRAAPDGRLLRRPQADLPRHRGAGNGQGLARAGLSRASQGRLRHPRRQPGPRGEHLDRPQRPAATSSSTS